MDMVPKAPLSDENMLLHLNCGDMPAHVRVWRHVVLPAMNSVTGLPATGGKQIVLVKPSSQLRAVKKVLATLGVSYPATAT
jgi:hypothetical protein